MIVPGGARATPASRVKITAKLAPRANWKGFLKIGEVTCPVALYTAASTSERIALHTINRDSGHRVHRQFIDAETQKPVEKEDQVKGYETAKGEYVMLEPEEVAAAVPESDKTLSVSAFIGCADIDHVYFDKPYYLAPADKTAEESFILIRDGMRRKKVAAIARTVLFRRVRTVLIRAHGKGLIANTLDFDYEVRSARDAFHDVSGKHIKGEMLELAEHIIQTKKGKFDISKFDDRYETALADLVKAKMEGKPIEAPKRPKEEKVVDLMAALRESAGVGAKKSRNRDKVKPIIFTTYSMMGEGTNIDWLDTCILAMPRAKPALAADRNSARLADGSRPRPIIDANRLAVAD